LLVDGACGKMLSIFFQLDDQERKLTAKYLRMMKSDTDALPLVETGARDCLTVRTGIDGQVAPGEVIDVLLDEKGNFIHLAQGLSLTIPPKENIPRHLFKPARRLTCYAIASAVLVEHEHLLFIEDSETHAIIAPKHDMHIQEYEAHLAETRPLWEVHNNDQ
jgi:hypothetical protein